MRALLACLVLTLALPALAGPFGLEKGMTVAELRAAGVELEADGDHWWRAHTAPRPHQAFDAYLLLIHPEHGLCKISAASREIEIDGSGTQARASYEKLERTLTGKYGAGEAVDKVVKGSRWRAAGQWARALAEGDAHLAHLWSERGGDHMPDRLQSIVLRVESVAEGEAVVIVSYEFDNIAACTAKEPLPTGLQEL
ncbi:MAG: hypothetical protein QM767_12635 [Anaeromyxobacter sp.]